MQESQSNKNRADLDKQAKRVTKYAIANKFEDGTKNI